MMLDLTKPIRFKNVPGYPCKILSTNYKMFINNKTVLGYVVSVDYGTYDIICTYTYDQMNSNFENVPEEKVFETWINIYRDYFVSHKSKENADDLGSNKRLACIHVKQTYKDGEGL
jgi:hypothetical protein